MRILIAHSSYRLAGGEDRYVAQQRELLSKHHEVDLLLKSNTDVTSGVRAFGQMLYSREVLNEVRERIHTFQPDVIHLHNSYPALGPAVPLAAKKEGVPLVMTVHNYRLRCPNGLTFTEGELCTRCVKGNYAHATLHQCFPTRSQAVAYAAGLWAHRFVLSTQDKVDLYIGPSQFVVDRLVAWGIEAERATLVRNFTDAPSGSSDPGEHGIYMGRLSSEKGLEVLIEALARAGNPPFLFIGTGPLEADLKGLTRNKGLSNSRFLGFLGPTELRGFMRNARFVAFPSLWHENAPLAALEAMAAGRPLLVTDRGGMPELVGARAGLSFRAGDADAAARAIKRFMEDDSLCRSAGQAAADFAREELTPQRHLRNLERSYQRVMASEVKTDE